MFRLIIGISEIARSEVTMSEHDLGGFIVGMLHFVIGAALVWWGLSATQKQPDAAAGVEVGE